MIKINPESAFGVMVAVGSALERGERLPAFVSNYLRNADIYFLFEGRDVARQLMKTAEKASIFDKLYYEQLLAWAEKGMLRAALAQGELPMPFQEHTLN